jgi:CDP-diacylglycerol--serine O-phosphatidyltransferase
VKWLAWGLTLFAGITMVSNVKYYSFKDFNLRRSVPFWAVLVVVAGIVVLAIDQPRVLLAVFLVYALSGYVMWGKGWWTRRRAGKHKTSE